MQDKTLGFLIYLPRSGSTVLSKILNENSDIFVSPTSPYLNIFTKNIEQLKKIKNEHPSGKFIDAGNFLKISGTALFNTEKKIFIDKNFEWSVQLKNYKAFVEDKSKVLLMIRPIEESVLSFYNLLKNNGVVNNNFIEIYKNHFKEIYENILALEKYKKEMCIFTYEQLLTSPHYLLEKIESYLGARPCNYNLDNISDSFPEDDTRWGLKNQHLIRHKLAKISSSPESLMSDKELKFFKNKTLLLYQALGLSSD